jgi:hypothetical protein
MVRLGSLTNVSQHSAMWGLFAFTYRRVGGLLRDCSVPLFGASSCFAPPGLLSMGANGCERGSFWVNSSNGSLSFICVSALPDDPLPILTTDELACVIGLGPLSPVVISGSVVVLDKNRAAFGSKMRYGAAVPWTTVALGAVASVAAAADAASFFAFFHFRWVSTAFLRYSSGAASRCVRLHCWLYSLFFL